MDTTTFSSQYSSDEYGRTPLQALFPEISLPRPVRFWLLLILLIPSILCTLILLYYFIRDRSLRSPLNNHVIIVLLIVNFHGLMIGFPIQLNFLHLGHVWPQIPTTCLAWQFSDIGIFTTTGIIMAWASIERHILIFHDQWSMALFFILMLFAFHLVNSYLYIQLIGVLLHVLRQFKELQCMAQ
ncbi:unnamed protein product [Rotaria sp. Silwood1]|nr:unnamed protein product [Rotaria sp. Silwood1]CAF3860280.1 unnamed protein product [Rotaria sp. Silwood1]CAF4740761.1 unnamed protein product [Rotaria sp. Silwood1]CAF5121974.1 unnamed protein product [Rotaria sp. Silwood1]